MGNYKVHTEKLNVVITKEMKNEIRQAIAKHLEAHGIQINTSDVVRSAIRLWLDSRKG